MKGEIIFLILIFLFSLKKNGFFKGWENSFKKIIVLIVSFITLSIICEVLFLFSFTGITDCKYKFDDTYTCNVTEETLIHKRLKKANYTGITGIKMFQKKPGDCGPFYTLKLAGKENKEYTLEHDHYDKWDFDPLSKLFKEKKDFIYRTKSYKINLITFCVTIFICLIILIITIRNMRYKDVDLMSEMSNEELKMLYSKKLNSADADSAKEEKNNSEKDFYNKEKL